jgi:hypothetical protein
MIRRWTRAAALGAALLLAAAPTFAADSLDPFAFPSPRELSMGGSHVALADDYTVLLANPAGLAAAPREVIAADLGLRLAGPVFDLLDIFVNGGSDIQTAAMDFLAASGYKLYAGLDLSGPLAVGYVGKGLGFGLFNKTSVRIDAASATSIGVFATEDVLLSGGYAFRFELGGGHLLDLGLGAKGFVRGNVGSKMDILSVAAMFDDPLAIVNQDFTLATGIGFDLGTRWSWRSLAAGLVCRDVFSPALVSTYSSLDGFLNDPSGSRAGDPSYLAVDRKLEAGFAWTPEIGILQRFIDSFAVAVDYRDILAFLEPGSRNPILNVGLGVEARLLEIVALRAGVNEGLLSAGAGIDMGFLKFGVSVLGTELGREPGYRPTYNLVADFSFRF